MLTHYPWLWGGSEMPAAQMAIYITEPWESHFLPHPRAPEAWKILALSLEILWLQEGPKGILVPSPTPQGAQPHPWAPPFHLSGLTSIQPAVLRNHLFVSRVPAGLLGKTWQALKGQVRSQEEWVGTGVSLAAPFLCMALFFDCCCLGDCPLALITRPFLNYPTPLLLTS